MTCLITNSNHSCSPEAGILLILNTVLTKVRIKNPDLSPCVIFFSKGSVFVLYLQTVRFDRKLDPTRGHYSWHWPKRSWFDNEEPVLHSKNCLDWKLNSQPVLIENLILLMRVIIKRNLTWPATLKCPYHQNFYFPIWSYLSCNEHLRKNFSTWIKSDFVINV